jgi:hypothetical protein
MPHWARHDRDRLGSLPLRFQSSGALSQDIVELDDDVFNRTVQALQAIFAVAQFLLQTQQPAVGGFALCCLPLDQRLEKVGTRALDHVLQHAGPGVRQAHDHHARGRNRAAASSGPRHSDRMTMVLFPGYRALQCTDVCENNPMPYNDFLDFYYDGWIETLDWLLQQDVHTSRCNLIKGVGAGFVTSAMVTAPAGAAYAQASTTALVMTGDKGIDIISLELLEQEARKVMTLGAYAGGRIRR